MAWILTILIAFWGLPLLVMMAVGFACLVSQRFRHAAARVIGLHPAPKVSPRREAVPVRHSGRTPMGDR